MTNRLIETGHIATVVNDVTGCNILTKTRVRSVVEARAIYYYLCRKYTNYTTAEIGETVGKDHSTVLHGLKSIEDWMRFDPNFNKELDLCDLKIKYIYQVLQDEELTVEEALSNLFTLEEENKKLLQTNIELLSLIEKMEENQRLQDKYLIRAGYKQGLSRLGMKYNTQRYE